MRYSVYIDYDRVEGGPENFIQFYPNMVSPFKIERVTSEDGNGMQRFFYRLMWGDISVSNDPYLYNKTLDNKYRLFEFIYNLSFTQKVFIRYITESGKTINGYFGRNDCEFDFNRKIFTVKPAVMDAYTDVLENWENDVDYTDWEYIEPTTTVILTNSTLKTFADWPWPAITSGGAPILPTNNIKNKDYVDNGELDLYFNGQAPKSTLFEDSYYSFSGTHRLYNATGPVKHGNFNLQQRVDILGEEGSPTLVDEYGDYELSMFGVYEGKRIGGLSGKRWRSLYCVTEFSRDETIKVDVADVDSDYGFEPPVGTGWHMRSARIKDGANAHLWTRKPFDGAYSNNWEKQPLVTNTGDRTYGFTWYKYQETKLIYDNSENSFEVVSTIKLKEFIEYLIQNTAPELSAVELKSTFLFNDFEDEMEVLSGTTGYNYVNGEKNLLNNLKLFFTTQLVQGEDSEVSKVPKFSLKDILNDFSKVFANTLGWFFDSNGYFRIEHQRYLDLKKTVIDLTASEMLNFTSQWSYDKSSMYERFEYRQLNAGYKDFTDNLVEFDKVVSNNRNQDLKSETETSIISTDARYCILNPGDLADGLVLIAVDEASNTVINKVGRISKVLETNGVLALSNILYDFGRYEGVWQTGIVNELITNFTVTKRNKLGIELSVKGAQESLFYVTQLGYGIIKDGTIDYENENTKITLVYRFNSTVNGDLFVLAFQKETDFVGAANNWADLDNFIISN